MKGLTKWVVDRRVAASDLMLIVSCALSLAVVALGLANVSRLMSGCIACGDSRSLLPGPFGVALAGLVLALALAVAGARVRYAAHD